MCFVQVPPPNHGLLSNNPEAIQDDDNYDDKDDDDDHDDDGYIQSRCRYVQIHLETIGLNTFRYVFVQFRYAISDSLIF